MKKDNLTVSRRSFIKQAGLLSLTCQPVVKSITAFARPTPDGGLIFYLIRPADMLCLQFHFTNCTHIGDVIFIDKNAKVSIRLPQQHVAEKFYNESELPLAGLAPSTPADFSYIIYNLKNGHLHFEVSKWLDWNNQEANGVFGNMVAKQKSDSSDPNTVTHLEFPYGVWLSPLIEFSNAVFNWDHNLRITDGIYNKRVELWTSRLKTEKADGSLSDPNFWMTRRLDKKTSFDNSQQPSNQNRLDIYNQINNGDSVDNPLDQRVRTDMSFFQISPLGITTKLLYQPGYKPDAKNKIVEWKEDSSYGRDYFTEIVTSGWLYPYMLRCDFVLTTRRVTIVSSSPPFNPQTVLIVKAKFKRSQETVVYNNAIAKSAIKDTNPACRGLPFSNVTLLTLESPEFDLDENFITINADGTESKGIIPSPKSAFWPVNNYDTQDYYKFHFKGIDCNNAPITFDSSFIFIPDQRDSTSIDINVVSKNYLLNSFANILQTPPAMANDSQFAKRNRASAKGQSINYVKNDGATGNLETQRQSVGNLQTDYFVLGTWPRNMATNNAIDTYTPVQDIASVIPFFPKLESAAVIYPALKNFISDTASEAGYQLMNYPAAYVLNGINDTGQGGFANAGKVFFKFAGQTVPVFDYDNYQATIALSSVAGFKVGDQITGNISKAVGKIVSISGLTATINDVVGTFTTSDVQLTSASGAVAAVTGYNPPLTAAGIKKTGALIKTSMKATAVSLINGIVSSAVDDVTEDLVQAINDKGSAFQSAIKDFIGQTTANLPKFSVDSFIPNMRLLGNDLKLTDLIANNLDIPVDDYLDTASEIVEKYVPIIRSIMETDYLTAELNWVVDSAHLQPIGTFLTWLSDNSQIALDCSQSIPLKSGMTPKTVASCTLTDFQLDFFGFVQVSFSKFSYNNSSQDGTKVNVSISDVGFGGNLSFVGMLASLLQTIDDALNLLISDAMIGISYALPVPTISLPCFSLAHIKIDTQINIPLDLGSMSFSFGLNSPLDPFTIAVVIFGGGGSIHASFNTKGIIDFGASFEFGGYEGLDIFVAEGCVYLFAGFYFDLGENCIILRAYVRCGGELNILDIVSASITFYLDLQYQADGGQTLLTGECTITYSISIAFFSIDVPLTLRKDFAGSAKDSNQTQAHACGPAMLVMADKSLITIPPSPQLPPLDNPDFSSDRVKFIDHMDMSDWREYIGAFSA